MYPAQAFLRCVLVIVSGCYQTAEQEELRQAYAPGRVFDTTEVRSDKIAFDSGPHRYSPVRISLVGYTDPESHLRLGERLVILLKGEFAVYLFLDRDNRILRSEVVGS